MVIAVASEGGSGWVACLALLVAIGGCGDRGASTTRGAADAFAVVRELPVGPPLATFASDTRAKVELSSVRAAALLSTGGAVLIDSKSSEVVEYAPDGSVRRVLGRRGDGPGEFRTPRNVVVLPGDTVVVYDARNGRLTTFPPGQPEPRVSTLPPSLFPRPPRDVWRLPGGGLVTYEGDIRSSEPIKRGSEGDLVGPEAIVRRVDVEAGTVDTLHSGTVADDIVQVGTMYLAPAFGRSTYVDVSGDVTAVALPTGFTVRLYAGAELQRVASLPEAERPLQRAEVVALRDSLKMLAAEAGQPFIGAPMFEQDLLPELRPDFSDLAVGPSGRALIREFAPLRREANTWWLLTPEGEFDGRVRLAPRSRVLQLQGDRLLLLRRDSLDVPRVELHVVDWSLLEGG